MPRKNENKKARKFIENLTQKMPKNTQKNDTEFMKKSTQKMPKKHQEMTQKS